MSASAGASRNPLRRFGAAAAARYPWLVDGYRLARNPRWELALRRDLRETRRSAAFLRAMPPPPSDAPVALVALYRDDVYDTKVGLVLATALRLHGLEPVVLMPSNRGQRVRRYARAFGVQQVIAADTLRLSPADAAECADAARQLLAGPLAFDVVRQWSFRDRNVGNHVLSTLIRTTFDGSPDLEVADNRARIEPILHDVLANVIRAGRLLDALAPHLVLVEEANYSTNGPLVDAAVARGVDVIQTIPIWRDDALASKRLTTETRRVDAKSVAPQTLARLAREPWTAAQDAELDADFDRRYGGAWALGAQFQPGTTRRSAGEIVAELGLDRERPIAVIFAHVLWDASLFYGVDLFDGYADWLVRSVGAALANPRVNWIVKAHPSNVFRTAHGHVGGESSEVALLREHYPDLPGHVRVLLPDTTISTRSLYEHADYGVTVRGTPGMEMACFGKPVLTAGTGAYSGLGFTYDSASVDEYLGRLAEIETYEPLPAEATELARRYAHTLFLRRPWAARSFEHVFDFPEQGWHPLDRNVVLTAGSIDELHRAGDLDEWAAWALETDDADFVPEGTASVRDAGLPARGPTARGARESGWWPVATEQVVP